MALFPDQIVDCAYLLSHSPFQPLPTPYSNRQANDPMDCLRPYRSRRYSRTSSALRDQSRSTFLLLSSHHNASRTHPLTDTELSSVEKSWPGAPYCLHEGTPHPK